MKKIFPFIIILFFVGIFFTPFFFSHKLPIPSDSLTGLYHPFRDFYAKEFPRGMPFKNFLITDPIRQQYEWRFLGYEIAKQGLLPLWNPYNGLGMPLLANQQSALLYPFNFLFFILPFSIAWSFQIFLTPLVGAYFMYLYLRQLKVSFLSSIFASISFSFCAFVVVWLEWNTVVQSFLWFSFILWSIEKLFRFEKSKQRILYTTLASLGLVFSLFAGHLQTFFYVGVVSTIYFLLKIVSLEKSKKSFLVFFLLFVSLFLLVSFIQLILTFQLISLSARSIDMDWNKSGWFIPYQHLLQFIIPDFFGNPTTLNYWGVWNYAELVGYIGIIPFLFALIGGLFVKRRVVYFFLGVVVISLLFSTANPIAKLPFLLHIPFLSTSQPTRLLSLIDFSLIILTAFGIDYLQRIGRKRLLFVLGIVGLIFLGTWGFIFFGNKVFSLINPEDLLTAKRNSVLPTGLFFIASLVLIGVTFLKNRKVYFVVICLLFILSIYDGIRFANKFIPFTSTQLLFPSTKTMTFLQQYSGQYRYVTTDNRILPPNVSAFYQLQSLDVYDPLYLQRYGEFVASLERGRPNIKPPFGFNRIIAPHTYNHPFINLLSVKYVVSLDSIPDAAFKKVFEEGQTKIYENTHVFPRVFFVKEIISAISREQVIEKLYEEKDNLQTKAVVTGIQRATSLTQGYAEVVKYTTNKVLIQTENTGGGFLVLTDAYYPTWHAYVDGKETKIYPTDYVLRGIFVPKGKHTIVFEDRLF